MKRCSTAHKPLRHMSLCLYLLLSYLLWHCCVGHAFDYQHRDQAARSVDGVASAWYQQLCGLWLSPLSAGQQLYEEWWFVSASEMQGAGGVVDAHGKRLSREMLTLDLAANPVQYQAQPNGQARTVFYAVSDHDQQARRWVNAQHDFPQVIRYRLWADDLEAHVTKLDDVALASGQRWHFKRAQSCLSQS